MLRRHLETCVAKAMQEGRTAEIVDELMDTLKFDKQVFRTPPQPVSDALLAAESSADAVGQRRNEINSTGEEAL
jgi:hypothetical protein